MLPEPSAHEHEKPELEHFLAILIFVPQRIQFGKRLGRHLQLNVALCGQQGAFD